MRTTASSSPSIPLLGMPPVAWVAIAADRRSRGSSARTALGRRIVMLGSNPEAARLVGVDPVRVRHPRLSALRPFAGLAGLVIPIRAGTGLPTDGTGMELQSIAAALIGGTALSGGVAGVLPVVLGARLHPGPVHRPQLCGHLSVLRADRRRGRDHRLGFR